MSEFKGGELLLVIIISLLLLLVSLVIIGEPLRLAISRFSKLFAGLDFLQALTVDVYFGGLIIYVVALLPLHLVNSVVMWAVLLFSAFLISIIYLKRLHKKEFKLPDKNDVFCYTGVIAIFLSALLIEVAPTASFIFGSVHDTSLSALFTEVMLENQQMPQTLQPYLPEGIIYPQGFFVIAAYSHLVLNFSVAEIPLHITPLFQALSVLGAYYLGKTLLNRKLAISLSFIFAFASPWPKLVTWGSNAFVFGFSLYFICLSLISNLRYSRTQSANKIDLFVIGILYGYVAAVHFMIFVVLTATMSIWILVNMLHYRRESIYRELMYLLSVTVASIVPISVFVYRAILWYPYPGHNLGVPPDVTVQPSSLETNKVADFFTGPISNYPELAVEVYLLAALGILVMIYYYKLRKLGFATRAIQVIGASILGCLAILFITLLVYLVPSLAMFIGESVRYGILLNTSIYLFLGIFFILIHHYLEERMRKKAKPVKNQIKTLRRYLPTLLVFSAISVPFVYFSVCYNVQDLTTDYGKYAVTKQDDLILMQWMRENLPTNATILANPNDAGGFIPAVSHHKIIYPFTASRTSRTYLTVVSLITQNVFNSTTYDLIKNLNVTHIFVGSSAILNNQSLWNPTLMLVDPHFELVKEIGASYLLKVSF